MQTVLAAACLCVLLTANAAARAADQELDVSQDALDLDAARWLSPQTDLAAFLTASPGECLRPPENEETRYLVETGRAAFNNPLLFGGLAARGGLSCNSCHRDGRDNPAFFVTGLSGDPGTADVTSSLFSKTREDGVFNPVPIPSLLDVAAKESFGTQQPAATLHGFIENAITDEFQGLAPPREIINAIAAYVAHLDSRVCPDGQVMQSMDRAWKDVGRSLQAAGLAIERGDGRVADFLILSAQNRIGAVHDRYADPGLSEERAALRSLSSSLAALRQKAIENSPGAQAALQEILSGLEPVRVMLEGGEEKSLYNLDALNRALNAPGGKPAQ